MAAIDLHTGVMTSPKHAPLSDAAFRLWVHALCWSKEHLTDGFLPASMLATLHPKGPKVVAELLRVVVPGKGPLWHEIDGGYRIHDYAEWQETKDRVQSRRQQWREKKAGQRQGHTPSSPPVSPGDSPRDSLESPPFSPSDGSGSGSGDGVTDLLPPSGGSDQYPTPPPPPRALTHSEARMACLDAVSLWNRWMPDAKVASERLTSADYTRLRGALASRSLVDLANLFERVAKSDYLTGRDGKNPAPVSLWRALEWASRVEAGEFDDRGRKGPGLRAGGVRAPTARTTAVVLDVQRNYRFSCDHAPTCTTWPECRDKTNQEAAS